MQTIYHFKSAEHINTDTIEAIKKEYKNAAIMLTVEEESDIIIPSEQKQFVRDSIAKYKLNPELLISEEEAWKIINAD